MVNKSAEDTLVFRKIRNREVALLRRSPGGSIKAIIGWLYYRRSANGSIRAVSNRRGLFLAIPFLLRDTARLQGNYELKPGKDIKAPNTKKQGCVSIEEEA